ncbi:hypothetical protein ACRQ5Q_14890 [Bradyrhizobium sp. PMVTL-01]|uniref:hypothetical protein n=1 Tax=Bradyrhizobium sp. PMVTL-01 TaxID=3434999 RepID=UPI003F71E68E
MRTEHWDTLTPRAPDLHAVSRDDPDIWRLNRLREEAGMRPLSPAKSLKVAGSKLGHLEYVQTRSSLSARHLPHNIRRRPVSPCR